MARYLVTGGAGFIGSHIAEALAGQGHYVRLLDNFSSGDISNLSGFAKKIDIIKGDICSPGVCLKAASGMDFVFHQAAIKSVPRSMKEPQEYNRVNIGGTLNMLEAAKRSRVRRFIFASSSSVYGQANSFPEKETLVPGPISPYALSKLTGEYYCRIFSLHFGVPAIVLRYFNVFGPRQPHDDEYAGVIPKFIDCLMHGRRPPVFGSGRQSRDFTFVKNVVEANLLAAKAGKLKYGIFNIACGRDITVLKIIRLLNGIFGREVAPLFLEKRAGDIFRSLADINRARREIRFRPTVDFETGLRLTVDYWRDHE
ncbi:MAG: NAD-dependent epimerase/dehydratase family protein [Candidatus Omnitrophica bacterium]|nr:NAD-dependent epimerase/dehydratase family protein [Candidatus Omnitrophota bacterium]